MGQPVVQHPGRDRPGFPDGYEGHITFYVEVPDVGAALEQAESLGGTRVMRPETILPDITLGQFKDPEGNVVGRVQSA
jgi:predicted enzyme related to lactoylglutathione lyase